METLTEIANKIEDLETFKKNLRAQYQSEVGASYTVTISRQIPTQKIELDCCATIMWIEKAIDSEIDMLKQMLNSKLKEYGKV